MNKYLMVFFAFFLNFSFATAEKEQVDISDIYPAAGKEVSITYTAETALEQEIIKQEKFEFSGGLELTDVAYNINNLDDKTKQVQLVLKVRSFKPGRIIIPAQKIILKNNEGKKEIAFREQYLRVQSLISEGTSDILDIQEPWVLVDKQSMNNIYLLLILLVVVLIVIFIIWKKRKKPSEEKTIPPWEKAFIELEEIRKLPLTTEEDVKNFYLKLSDVFREYIENRFGIMALEKTTYEFIALMRKQENIFDANQQKLIRTFLDRCDLIKFARQKVSDDEPVYDIKLVREFVESSRISVEDEKRNNL